MYKEGWTEQSKIEFEDRYAFLEGKQIFCVLRDPYQRYLSGFVQYLSSADSLNYNETIGYSLRKLLRYDNKSNFDVLRLAFGSGKFDFDIHTQLQIDALSYLAVDNIDVFYMTDKLGFQLNKYFQKHNMSIPFNNTKINVRPDGDFYKSLLRDFFEKEEHVIFKENLLNYLKPDYDLIKSTNFYDG